MAEYEYTQERHRMVIEQIARRGVKKSSILEVMKNVPRHLFIPVEEMGWAYADGPLPIGQGQTISQPYIVALMSELLGIEAQARVLEVGTGSGYQAAVLGELAAEVHTIELIPELARKAKEILTTLGYTDVHVHLGDGSMGWKEAAPYDGILVTAASPIIPPPLLEQLADGGRLVIPVGGHGIQVLEVVQRKGNMFVHEKNIAVAFVPLRGEYGWK
jgi:protein-L-isoaspartate(D-aspartate) O-methyltransferase